MVIFVNRDRSLVFPAPLYLNSPVTKNKLADKDKMKCSNNYNLCVKCYINVFYVVPSEMESSLS